MIYYGGRWCLHDKLMLQCVWYSVRLFPWISPCTHFFLEKNCKLINNPHLNCARFSSFPRSVWREDRCLCSCLLSPLPWFFPSQLCKAKPVFTVQVTDINRFHTASKNNSSAAQQSSEWCNQAPKQEWHIMTAYVTSRQTPFLCSVSLSGFSDNTTWHSYFHKPGISLGFTPWFIWKCVFSRLISGV